MRRNRALGPVTWLAAVVLLVSAGAAQVPDFPPGTPDGFGKDVAVIATEAFRDMGLHGPWEPDADPIARATWYPIGTNGGQARIQFGHPQRVVEWTLPQYEARRGAEGRRWERLGDYVKREPRGSIEIGFSLRGEGNWTWNQQWRDSYADDSVRRVYTDLGEAPERVLREIAVSNWYERRDVTVLGEPGEMTREGTSPRLERWARVRRSGRFEPLYRVAGEHELTRVRLRLLCERPLMTVEVNMRNNAGEPADETLAIRVAEVIIAAARRVRGIGDPPPVAEPAPAAPVPEPDPDPEPEREPTPEPEAAPDRDPVTERDPWRPEATPEDRLDEMDDVLAGIEDRLQASLMAIQILTQQQVRHKLEMRERSAVSSSAEGDERQKAMADVRRLLGEIQSMGDLKRRFARQALEVMAGALAEVERIEASYGFGPLELSAALRVEAARARMALLRAQIELANANWSAAQKAAARMRDMPAMGGTAYWVEAMALLGEQRPDAALDAFRVAERLGYAPPEGSPFEALARDTETRIIRAIQSKVTGDAARFHDLFETWIASKAETARDRNRSRFGTAATRLIWRGWYDSISGALGAGAAGARADEVAIVADDATMSHVGLGIIASLRRDHRLDAIATMNRDAFADAVRRRWDRDFDPTQLEAMRRAVVHAMKLDDMRLLASGEMLEASGLLSHETVQHIGGGEGWETAAAAGNFVNGWTMMTTFASGARLSLRRPWLGGADELSQSATLGEWFAASRPMQMLGDGLQSTPGGTTFLQTMSRIHQWGERGGIGRTAAILAGEAVGMGVVSHITKEKLGEDAALFLEFLSILGIDSPDVYHQLFQRSGMGATQAVQTAQSLRQAAAGIRRRVTSLDGAARNVRNVLDDAGSPNTLATARRQIAAAGEDVAPLATRLDGAVRLAEAGEVGAARRMLEDFERAQSTAMRRARQVDEAAAQLDQLGSGLPEPIPDPGLAVVDQSRRNRLAAALDDEPPGTVRDPTAAGRGGDRPGGLDPDEPPGTRVPDEPPRTRDPNEPPRTRDPDEPPRTRDPNEPPRTRDPDEPPRTRDPDEPPRTRDPNEPAVDDANEPPATRAPGDRSADDLVESPIPDELPEPQRTTPDPSRDPGDAGSAVDVEGGGTQGSAGTRQRGASGQAAGAPAGRNPTRGDPDGRARLYPEDPASPYARADELMADERFGEAVIEYQRVAVGLDPADPRFEEVQALVHQARAAKRADLRNARTRGQAPRDPPPAVLDDPSLRAELAEATANGDFNLPRQAQGTNPSPDELVTIGQPAEPHTVPVKEFFQEGGQGTAGAPRYVYGRDGKRLGVVKERYNTRFDGHDEGKAEELASRLSELLGRKMPRTRVEQLPNTRGGQREMVVGELLPDGKPLQDMLPESISSPAQLRLRDAELLAIKDELTEDIAFSLIMGDGDRHFGNIWITADGEVVGFDYGLADIFPTHTYRVPGRPTGVAKLYHEAPVNAPTPGTREFDDFVRHTSEMHLQYALRSWANGHGVLRSALRRGDLKRQLSRMRETMLRQLPDGRTALDAVVDEAFAGHPHQEYVRAVLKKRLELLDEVIDTGFNRGVGIRAHASPADTSPIALGRAA